jgi:hypothetical protein
MYNLPYLHNPIVNYTFLAHKIERVSPLSDVYNALPHNRWDPQWIPPVGRGGGVAALYTSETEDYFSTKFDTGMFYPLNYSHHMKLAHHCTKRREFG